MEEQNGSKAAGLAFTFAWDSLLVNASTEVSVDDSLLQPLDSRA